MSENQDRNGIGRGAVMLDAQPQEPNLAPEVVMRDPIYPQVVNTLDVVTGQNFQVQYHGLSRRDYFAAQALVGLIATGQTGVDSVAQQAFEYADTMLKYVQR